MPISLAGVGLTPPVDVHTQITEWWHGHRIDEFDHPAYFSGRWINHLPIPAPPKSEPPRIGVLRWPTGASRWATCHLIATAEQLADIRTAAGSTAAPMTLMITDSVTTITTSMYLLPPRPILQKDSGDLYLLTLVDERWFWWDSGNQSAPITPPSTWGSLLTSLFTSVGVTPTISTIPSGYGEPTPIRWNVLYKPIPLLIDAAAACVGLRVVRQLDGTVSVQSYSDASASDTAMWTAYRYEVYTGGQFNALDIARTVPANVSVVFWGFDPVVVNKSLTSLAISAYGGRTGLAGRYGQIVADLPAVADSADQTAYATQAATDYYNWAQVRSDYTLRGLQNRVLNGNDSCQEWVHSPSQMVTRVITVPFSDSNVYGDAPPQRMFPAKITSAYNATTGYDWERLTLDTTVPGYVVTDVPKTGDMLFDVKDNQTIAIDTQVLMWSNPDGDGWEMDQAPAIESCSATGSAALCCGPGATVFPDSNSEPTDIESDPYVVVSTECHDGILWVIYGRIRTVWESTICRPVMEHYGYELYPEGCCACESGTGSATGTTATGCCPEGTAETKYVKWCGGDAFWNPETYGLPNFVPIEYVGEFSGIKTWVGFITNPEETFGVTVQLSCGPFVVDGSLVYLWKLLWFISWPPGTQSACGLPLNTGSSLLMGQSGSLAPNGGMAVFACDPFCGLAESDAVTYGTCELVPSSFVVSDDDDFGECDAWCSGSGSSSGDCCTDYCDTYLVNGETLTRYCGVRSATTCVWTSATYFLAKQSTGWTLWNNATNPPAATCAWNGPNDEDWDGTGCVTFEQTTTGACGDIEVCCGGDSGTGTGSASGSASGDGCTGATPISGTGGCGGSPTLTMGVWYNLDVGWAGWAVSPSTNYRFEWVSTSGITVSFIAAVSYCTGGSFISGGFTDGGPASGCVTLTTLSDSTFLHVIMSGATTNCIRLVEGSC